MASDPDPVRVAEEATVTDVFVDWHVNAANTPTLTAIVDGSISRSGFQPVSGGRDEKYWLGENDHGLFFGWQEGLPVSEETGRGWSPTPVEHVDYGTVEDRYRMLSHVIKRVQNDREEASVLNVTYAPGIKGSPSDFTTRVDTAYQLVERYVNGPLGSDDVSYWYWKRTHPDGPGFRRAVSSREDYEGFNDCDIVLVDDGIYTWRPKRAQDVTPADDVCDGP